MSKPGDEVRVVKVGGSPEVKKHLEDLGFVQDTPVEIIQSCDGNMIVRIKDSKLAITRSMAEKIRVR